MSFSRSDLLSVKHIYSHASCYDGTASAMICVAAYTELGVFPEVHFIQYGTQEHEEVEAGPNQLWVDITPPLKRWNEWIKYEPVVLDHHKTAQQVVIGLHGVYGEVDNTESGASLAFKHIYQTLLERQNDQWFYPLQEFSKLVAIRDTWQEQHPDWDKAQGMVRGLDLYSNEEILEIIKDKICNAEPFDFENLLDIGVRLYQKTLRKAKKIAENALIEMINGKKVGFFNCTEKIISEVCHILINEYHCEMAVGYFIMVEHGKLQTVVSLRSSKNGILVNQIAKKHGGGGHDSAAGFRFEHDFNIPISYILNTMCDDLN